MQVTVEVPDDLAAALNLKDRDPAGAALEAMALEALSRAEVDGIPVTQTSRHTSRLDFWEFLKERQIETYTFEDLEHDLALLKTVLPAA
jgi:hypothetical protein